jgi:hypothetical protein
MPTDPYVPNDIDSDPRQLPNLAPGVHLPPAGSWRADRPGDLVAGQPHGEMLGSPGPDVGYARLLVERRRDHFVISPTEPRDDAEAVVAELAMKRAASFGRAPVTTDVDIAMELLGYAGDVPLETPAWRLHLVHEAAHDYAKRRRIVDSVPVEVLRLPSAQVAAAMAGVRSALEAVAAHEA